MEVVRPAAACRRLPSLQKAHKKKMEQQLLIGGFGAALLLYKLFRPNNHDELPKCVLISAFLTSMMMMKNALTGALKLARATGSVAPRRVDCCLLATL